MLAKFRMKLEKFKKDGELFPSDETGKVYRVALTGNEINAIHFAEGFMAVFGKTWRPDNVPEAKWKEFLVHLASASADLTAQTELG